MKLTAAQARKLGIPVPKAKRRSPDKASEEFRRQAFLAMCRSHGIPEPQAEFRFDEQRKWKFDWAWPGHASLDEEPLALEIQGGIWTGGRHVRGAALLDEMEKLNEAAIRGFRVLYATPDQVTTGEIFPVIRRALNLEDR